MKMLKRIRVVLDPPLHNKEGVKNDVPEDYLDFEVDFTSKFQYDWFYELVRDGLAMIERWKDGEDV